MKQTVYIDVLFFTNFAMDALIFMSAAMLLKRTPRWWRILVASAAGAACSCAVFFCVLPGILATFAGVLMYALCALILFGWRGPGQFLKCCGVVLLSAVIYGGAAVLLYMYTGVGSVMAFSNNTLYIDIPVFALLCFSCVVFFGIKLFSHLSGRLSPDSSLVDVKLVFGESSVAGKGLIDTGNLLQDAITGMPVIVCEYALLRDIFTPGMQGYLKNSESGDIDLIEDFWRRRLRMISCSTVTGAGLLPGVKSDRIEITRNKRALGCHNVIVAITDARLSENGQYSILLSQGIMERSGIYEKAADADTVPAAAAGGAARGHSILHKRSRRASCAPAGGT